ncbi:histidine kinase dimerization/phosphoacceptor domain -containing protein [Chitinophaga sp. sic0106]|uniref:histidine kinase dimerization/phosphoacceptor domain -containing protein n=1 Tax=Chitinophaga sp. sic0106 TaxID=2854785 RepID=UPI001C46AE86|nr:histidine kinase dimerization/phosphoacceptor domain -containing protein [Chitinophaga sp. sic0106]MBV7532133.1 tetratricopeptide repeat protein [Chitinophaga sp. sic0106]
MYKNLLFFCCLLCCSFVYGQDQAREPIPVLLRQLRSIHDPTLKALHLLAVADSFILKPGEAPHDLDTALVLINQSRELNVDLEDAAVAGIGFTLLSKYYREKGQRARGKVYARKSVEWAAKHHLDVQSAYALVELASYYDYDISAELDEKIRYNQQAADLFGKTGRLEMQARTLEHLGDCLSLHNDLDAAISNLLKAVRLYKAAGVTDLLQVYNLLGNIYADAGDYQEALRYMLLSLRSGKPGSDTTAAWIPINNHAGIAYFRVEDFKEAARYFQQGMVLAEKYKDTAGYRFLLANYANTMNSLGKYRSALDVFGKLNKLGDIPVSPEMVGPLHILHTSYIRLHKLDSAAMVMNQMSRITSSLPFTHRIKRYYYVAAVQQAMAEKRFRDMKLFADSMELSASLNKFPKEVATANLMLFRADSALHFSPKSVQYYQRHIAIRDSLLNEAKLKQVNRLKIEFESAEKDENILELRKTQQEKDDKLKAANFRMKVFIGGVLMLLVLLILLYNRYQIKQRSNRLLMEQKVLIDSKNERLEVLNKTLQRTVNDKEWLLKEIHHRVKNNLQIVISLLKTQSAYLDNGRAKDAISQSQNRMFAMSIIHQRLYRQDNLASIDMQDYIGELVEYLRQSFESAGNLRFVKDVAKLELDVAQAVPIGLILNEAITNAIKYAFPEGRYGEIRVVLRQEKEGELLLEVADNGVGLSAGVDLTKIKSMGMNLIRTLTEQLDGYLEIHQESGLCLQIRFPLEETDRDIRRYSTTVLTEKLV